MGEPHSILNIYQLAIHAINRLMIYYSKAPNHDQRVLAAYLFVSCLVIEFAAISVRLDLPTSHPHFNVEIFLKEHPYLSYFASMLFIVLIIPHGLNRMNRSNYSVFDIFM